MKKYIKKFNHLDILYKISVIAIGVSALLLILLFIFVFIPLTDISENELTVITSSNELDRIVTLNNVLSVLIVVSSLISLVFVLLGRKRHAKKKLKKRS